jgi:hypothetical protein
MVGQVMDWTFEWVELRMRARDWLPDGDVVLGSRVGMGGLAEAEDAGGDDAEGEGGAAARAGEESVRVACNATWREVQVRRGKAEVKRQASLGKQRAKALIAKRPGITRKDWAADAGVSSQCAEPVCRADG